MTDWLTSLGLEGHRDAAIAVGLGAARLTALVWIAPFLGGRWIPVPARLGVALALALVCAPTLAAAGPLPADRLVLLALLVKEIGVGLAIGFAMALVFHSAEAAGDLIDTARGQSMSELLDPATGEPASPMGALYGLLAVAIFMVSGGHLVALEAILASFEAVPVAGFPAVAPGALGLALLTLTAHLLVVAAALAGPALIALLLADSALGLVTRAAPQLNAYFLALPLKSALGLLAVLAGLSVTVRVLHSEFGVMLDRASGLF